MLILCASSAFAATSYEQPFAAGTQGSRAFRIPSLITLNDGSVLASVDMRYDHGQDSPNNLDTVVAKSQDGYTAWETSVVNYFADYPLGVTNANSASFIDPAMVQSKQTGRIFLIVDAFPSGGGAWACEKGTGFVDIAGDKYLVLTNGDNKKSIDKFEYLVKDFENGFAKVVDRVTRVDTGYAIDEEYNLYKDGQPLYMTQNGSDAQVQQNVFYVESDLTVFHTMYQWLRYSDDNGATWSAPKLITDQIKYEKEGFLGIAPGKGAVTTVDGKERILFVVYDNSTLNTEMASTIYSDDNGETWHRGERVVHKASLGKTSESQIITLPDGTLRMYCRNTSNYIGYADSKDGGVTWTTAKADTDLECTKNCMVSFINYSRKIDGKSVIIASYASNLDQRADGLVRVGLIDDNNDVEWISSYHVNQSFFAYSCLTELADGNIGLLCEDELDKISYRVLSISDSGELTDVSGNNIEFKDNSGSVWDKIKNVFRQIIKQLQIWFGIL